MAGAPIDRLQIKKATAEPELWSQLVGERLLALIAAAAAVITAGLLVYLSYGRDRLELVYIEQDRYDAPVLLTKVRGTDDSVKADRWVRGFVNRFIRYYFLNADDSDTFADEAIVWIHAHTGPSGQHRSESIHSDMKSFNGLRKRRYVSFFPVNDMSTLKIRQSSEDSRIVFVEQPGTYITKTEKGESIQNATLKLAIQKIPVSGIESDLGGVNATGLIVVDGSIEFVADYTRPNEITRQPLFQNVE